MLSLLGIAAVWGLSFPAMKAALEYVTPFELLAMRNLLGFLALAVLWGPKLCKRANNRDAFIDAYTMLAGVVLGAALVAGLALQVVGLQTTTSVKAGFISGLYVIFTPFVAIPVLDRQPSLAVILSAIAATVGLFLLTVGDVKGISSVSLGDVLNVGAAVSFAVHVALTGKYAPRCDYKRLCLVEAFVKALAFSPALLRLDLEIVLVSKVAVAVLVTGLGATALGLAVQTWAQRRVSAPATAVIFSSEPAFAGLFGLLLLGESLSTRGLLGAGILLIAIVVAARHSSDDTLSAPA
ncbi:MAG: hypothetical protein C4318_03690 [Acidimicrobiia bacterium]